MRRNEPLEEISDGRRYGPDDLVRIGTGDCRGCSDCCRMDPLIVLDPCDAVALCHAENRSFEELLEETVELRLIDGLILPVLKMKEAEGGGASSCSYLEEDGRCRIHALRPGICRMYPLGRAWENGDFFYIYQVNECTHPGGAKIRVRKWLGIQDLPRYEAFVRDWHDLLTRTRDFLDQAENEKFRKSVSTDLLRRFFFGGVNPDEDFYPQYDRISREARQHLGFAV